MTRGTRKVAEAWGAGASLGSDLNGAAVMDACRKIQANLAPVAASLLEWAEDAVRYEDGLMFAEEHRDSAIPFRKLVETAYLRRVPLFAHGYYRTPEIHYDPKTGQGRPFYYYVYGAAVAEVEVDGFTGDSKILRVDILEDAGRSLSPLVDRGQIEGGFIQGAGWLTLEELVWDA